MINKDPYGARHGISGLSSAAVAAVEALCGADAPTPGAVQPAAPAPASGLSANVLLHLAGPIVGAEVREVVRDLARVAGVIRVRPGAKLAQLLLVDYDPAVVAAQSLVAHARRRWTAAQLVGM